MSSITEVVQTVKHPRSHSDEKQEPLPVSVPGTPSNKSPVWDLKKEDARLSRRMSGRASLMGSVSVSLKDATHAALLPCHILTWFLISPVGQVEEREEEFHGDNKGGADDDTGGGGAAGARTGAGAEGERGQGEGHQAGDRPGHHARADREELRHHRPQAPRQPHRKQSNHPSPLFS
jgi:hypothetical protein